jgi:hypothetical protein
MAGLRYMSLALTAVSQKRGRYALLSLRNDRPGILLTRYYSRIVLMKGISLMAKKGFSHESSKNKTVEWYTPRYIFDALGVNFDLDPCSPGKDITPWVPAKECYSLNSGQDGLMLPWKGNVWMNPPYGKHTPVWLERLAIHGNGIALLFSRTDAVWFHKFVAMADAICFVKGRVCFIHERNAEIYASGNYKPNMAERPGAGSMLIAYGKENANALHRSGLGLTFNTNKESST